MRTSSALCGCCLRLSGLSNAVPSFLAAVARRPSQYEKMVQFRPWPQWLLRFGYRAIDRIADSTYAEKLNIVR